MEENRPRRRWLLYLLAVAAVIAADQGLKAWIQSHIPLNPAAAQQLRLLPGIVHLSHIHNYGAAFGMLQNARWVFLALLLAFCALVIWALVTKKLVKGWERWLAVLALGGALSNGIDRAVNGFVVDMFELEFMNFAIFNLADAVINVCCIAFAVLILFQKETKSE